jgi:hypothetical protein
MTGERGEQLGAAPPFSFLAIPIALHFYLYYNNSKTLIGIGGSQPCYFKADKEVRE